MMHTDELFMECHFEKCRFRISERVDHAKELTPLKLIRWHERMIGHVRRVHIEGKKR